ncbi:enoyl-CoA hydratase/isomerase family protein [Novosphingobium mangrovi (ex Huang et al. 2023)]|uniref:Enoyl-CoA hydratase/isomerase family protein n=1 Tax=Novosphingobium mangrovi (ex Huang et al. 2023) TaxID=2976432 RepID=A0ABT2I553_9SPHN|nr:enoyl-CoA hydratase/isomerase family protein [Novosphingobium mangrovi (ex Huang et al. 2023)]MCT2399925.1 enoyl-CoA hydratase/isomerase family protein [Novosphingobium mangrovi (ex Huang et al. 2023)]
MTRLSDYAEKYQGIAMTREGGVLEMTLHTRGGPAKWGSSPDSLHGELGDAFLDVARDPENKVIVLTGTGESFIDGFDPSLSFPEPDMASMWPRIYDEGNALLQNLLAIPMPMIAAVNGPALIHAEIPVMCDIVLAAEHAEFADLAHFPNGTVPGDGVHVIWPMLLGPNRGRYFLLTGERIGASEANRLGVVGEVLPPAELLPRARALAQSMAAMPTAALRYTRSLLTRELRRRMADELASGLAHEALATLVTDKG